LLERVRNQEGDFDVRVVVVDSGSTDGTDELARRYGATVHAIPRSEFNHGATRNLGISLTDTEYVVLTVQDAIPHDGTWLGAMIEVLESDERVAGVFGRQVPHPRAGAVTRVLVNSLASASTERREQFAGGPGEYRELPPARRRRLAAFDNVSSCIRRSVWERIPFEKTTFGEDIRWGKRVVEAGYKTVYEPRSTVYHSHERGPLYDLRRYYVDGRILRELFGLVLIPNALLLLPATARSFLRLYRLLRREGAVEDTPRLAWTALTYSAASQLGAFLGANSDSLAALAGPRLFGRLHGYLSRGV
jgi:rhamnosyltransferase